MFKRMRILPRFTFANVVAMLALFVVLGGTAAAAFVVNSNADIAPGTVFGSVKPAAANDNVVDGSLGSKDLAGSSVTTTKVANGAITRAKLAVIPLTGNGRASFDRVTIPVGQSLGEVVATGGFTRYRRAAETPFNLVLEARP
jgi:hypothetical protein